MKQQKVASVTALIVLTGIVLLSATGLLLNRSQPNFQFLPFIGGVSTLAVALLTVAYVLTTSDQLSVMHAQLDQMRRSRDFEAQPLPIVEIERVKLEKPRFFYTPPEDSYSALTRTFVYLRLRNSGTHPAVNVICSGKIYFPPESHLNSPSILAEVLPESSVYPSSGDLEDFMFIDNDQNEFLNSLRVRDSTQQPVLQIRTIYRNALGSAFAATCYYKIRIPNASVDSTLAKWHSALVALPVRYKDDILSLKRLRNKDTSSWEEKFNFVKHELDSQVNEIEELELQCFSIPLSFRVLPMSDKDYEAEAKGKHFSALIPHWVNECIFTDNA